ncbi:MAG: (d)CMP kinase [Megasphaera sp.]|jgi:cytidylate kinase|nr:(d)CMP kinase [Megasphaera sp.]MCH4187083.1 (d)CMP kinase [Megasphaera sp.]MCH4216981.1 (d)CMP kinase [Megasphaera sp.]
MKKLTVAIDGPAGAGKSSVAKVVANRLHYLYIDTGAMYRAFTWAVLSKHVDIADERAVQKLTDTLRIRLEIGRDQCRVYVDDTDVTEAIRTSDVSSHVSAVAALAVVRQKLVQLQRDMAKSGGVILDGRDIGTVVLPDADVKIFLTASVRSRAMRRYLEVQARGNSGSLEEIEASIAARDDMDSHRAIAPLKQADDAILLDNSELDLEGTADAIMKYIEAKGR